MADLLALTIASEHKDRLGRETEEREAAVAEHLVRSPVCYPKAFIVPFYKVAPGCIDQGANLLEFMPIGAAGFYPRISGGGQDPSDVEFIGRPQADSSRRLTGRNPNTSHAGRWGVRQS